MDNNRLDALFSGLTRTNEAEDKQPIQQETSANTPSTPAKKTKAGNARAKQKKFETEKQVERFCTIVKTEEAAYHRQAGRLADQRCGRSSLRQGHHGL